MAISDHIHDRGMYTRAEAAEMIGRHPDTVRRWERAGMISPEMVAFGDIMVPAFTPADIARLREIADSVHVGRPKKAFSAAARDPKTLQLVDIDTLKRRKR